MNFIKSRYFGYESVEKKFSINRGNSKRWNKDIWIKEKKWNMFTVGGSYARLSGSKALIFRSDSEG